MDQVAQVREKIDIVSFIAEYIPLKRAGRNFHTQCPFHTEKTPSFVVSPERQIWHCFGCQKGGDAFTFLMEYERLEFIEALRILAKKTGVPLQETQFDKTISTQKDRLYSINKAASEFYYYVLTEHKAGKKALDYLLEVRKLNASLIKTFFIGYSPKPGTILCNYLVQKKKYSPDDVIAAGLGYYRQGRLSDFFVNRIMFPLTDHRGNVIGFSGRVFQDDGQVAKYVNTRETLIYHKGSVFFGLDSAKEEIKKQNKAIIMEGEFDVISSFAESIKNVVAVKGTALTENQVALLSRYAQKVALCFDQDKAGQDAIKRSLPTLEKKGITTTIVVPPFGKDADEALHSDPVSFKKAVLHDVGVYDYLLEKASEEFDKSNAEGKRKISEELLPFFSAIENEIVKEHYLRRLSTELDTSYESLIRQIEKIGKKEKTVEKVLLASKEKVGRQELLEEQLTALIVQHKNPAEFLESVFLDLQDCVFKVPAYKKILDILKEHVESTNEYNNELLAKKMPPELLGLFDTCFLLPMPEFEDNIVYVKEIKKTVKELKHNSIKEEVKALSQKMKEHEKSGEEEKVEKLQEKLIFYTNLLKNAKY